ncbi:MAG: LPS export ABC transporter periplasmic protein LptC [Flavobacteriaceae bacterium]
MKHNHIQMYLKSIAVTWVVVVLFLSCNDSNKPLLDPLAQIVSPQGIAENFTLYYTETDDVSEISIEVALGAALKKDARLVAILRSSKSEDFQHLDFPYRTFPDGLVLEVFDAQNNKSIIKSDYGIIYSATNVIDLRGNVVILTHDGKKVRTPQLFYDKSSEWIFTSEKFTYINPDNQTVMDGKGMDFNRDFSFLNAHKTFGYMTIKESEIESQTEKDPETND